MTTKRQSLYYSYSIIFFSTFLVLTAVTASQIPLATGSTSPYQSGYNHGCSDARISDPSDRYINEPGKGPSFHTPAFMNGYYTGYNACSGGGSGGGGVNSVGGTFADGNRVGKTKGESDALNGRPFDDRCGGPTNDYCLGYKVGYGIEYRVTKLLRDK